jgi:putative FmdB family regulatory protein
MPLYEYECRDHGVFEEARSIAESAADSACPVCLATARRIVSATNLGRLERSQVKAMDRNERSRHEPRVVRTESNAEPTREGRAPPLRAAGGGYPWAIGH